MKKLQKILLVNWLYFSKQIIEVDDINFLTGKNGAGKSTVIDALQIVLLGETNARNFNQAANEKSQRTLDGYLRADMDENNPWSRRGKDFSSYIACEFCDEGAQSSFVTGVVFDCHSDGSWQERYFIYDGELPEHCFIQQDEAMDLPALRAFLKQNYGARAKLYDTQRQYRADMLSKWNVHNEQVIRMMKKAVSFRPIVDIQKFITENICDIPDKPNIEDMQQNIQDYKRHEQLAQCQQEKLEALQQLQHLHQEMSQALERWQRESFLVLWAEKESLEGEISIRDEEKQSCQDSIARIKVSFDQVAEQIEEKEREKTQLITACAQSDVSREEEKLRANRQALLAQQSTLTAQMKKELEEIQQEAALMCGLCHTLRGWQDDEILSPVKQAAEAVNEAYRVFLNCDCDIFAKPAAVFEQAQQVAADFAGAVRDAAYKIEILLADLRVEQDQKKAVLANLRKNVKDYPKGLSHLKERLAQELEGELHEAVQIDILADVLELPEQEEHWRRAVEGYLNTQKFYLLVPPQYYTEALGIYDRLKQEYGLQSFGLVDVGKLREQENIAPKDDSLAKKVETDNELARSYVDYLLGRVVCCDHVEQLREHKMAITAEGMLYQGYVARPIRKELMDDAFIGRRAIALRIERLELEHREVGEAISFWNPIYYRLSEHKNYNPLFSRYFVQSIIVQRQEDYCRRDEITKKLEDIEQQLSHLDLLWLHEQHHRIETLTVDIATLRDSRIQKNSEMTRQEERVRQLDYEILPGLYQQLTQKEERLSKEFTKQYVSEVGIPSYEQELQQLKNAPAVYKIFYDQLPQALREREVSKQKLVKARSEYAQRFQVDNLDLEAVDNRAFAAEQKRLEDSELPRYHEKIKAAQASAMEQFQNDFLAKLKSSIDRVRDQVDNLNRALKKAQFGTDRYQFRVDRNPDYADYYDMIMAPELMEGEVGLFALPFQKKYGNLIEELFRAITMADDTQFNARQQSELQQNIERYTDFRTYLKFDLETVDQNGAKQLLSQTLNTKSGGETQTPFYIAVLASFAQLYQVNNLSEESNNTVRLVVFDEAFNKMDSERIMESVRLLRKMGLQAIICTPPDKLPDIMPLADRTLLVSKNKYQMHILSYGKEISDTEMNT